VHRRVVHARHLVLHQHHGQGPAALGRVRHRGPGAGGATESRCTVRSTTWARTCCSRVAVRAAAPPAPGRSTHNTSTTDGER
jgi:hypothetical protein